MRIIRILARHFLQRQVAQTHDIDWRGLPSAIALPGGLPEQVWHVGNPCSVWRKPRFFSPPHRQNICRAAIDRNGVEAVEVRIGLAPGIKKHSLPVRSPPHSNVRRRVPGKPFRLAPFRWNDEYVDIPVVLACKRDPFSVRRKHRQPFMSAGGQLPGIAPVARHAPEVAAVRKNHMGLACCRRMRQQRRLFRCAGHCRKSQ